MGLLEVKEKIKKLYSNDISILDNSYIDTKHKASFICNKHKKEFSAFLTNVLQGNCASCELCKSENKREIDLSKVIPKIHNKQIEITGHHMIKNHVYIDFKCLNCNNNFSQRKDSIVYKDNNIDCPYCGIKKTKQIINGTWSAIKKTTEIYKQEVYNLVGEEYSVLEEYKGALTPMKMRHNICGNIWEIKPNNFLSGNRRCPYCASSKGEKKIEEYLNKNNIPYESQKRYDDLLGLKNGSLSYDFYLPQYNTLIEYQGAQHSHSVIFFGGEESFKTQKEHDRRKREYAILHNINLLEIWYYDFNNIEDILNNYLVA